MNSILTEEVTAALVSLIVLAIGVASLYLRKLMQNLTKQMTPNGGKSMYDQFSNAMEISRKALEMSVLTNSEVRDLKTKVDALILSGIPKG